MLVIHPRKEEEGIPLNIDSVCGTAKATQEADNVIILQRTKERGLYMEVKKNRYTGDLGDFPVDFDRSTRRVSEIGFMAHDALGPGTRRW